MPAGNGEYTEKIMNVILKKYSRVGVLRGGVVALEIKIANTVQPK